MKMMTHLVQLSLVLSCSLFLAACGSNKPKPATVEGTISASAVINPDLKGEYRPVNIKLFFLKNDATFQQAGFNELFSRTDATLGDELVYVLSKQVLPGQSLKLEEEIPEGTKYVGAIAAFRALEDARWRDIKPVPEKCWSCRGPGLWNPINISIDRLTIDVSIED